MIEEYTICHPERSLSRSHARGGVEGPRNRSSQLDLQPIFDQEAHLLAPFYMSIHPINLKI